MIRLASLYLCLVGVFFVSGCTTKKLKIWQPLNVDLSNRIDTITVEVVCDNDEMLVANRSISGLGARIGWKMEQYDISEVPWKKILCDSISRGIESSSRIKVANSGYSLPILTVEVGNNFSKGKGFRIYPPDNSFAGTEPTPLLAYLYPQLPPLDREVWVWIFGRAIIHMEGTYDTPMFSASFQTNTGFGVNLPSGRQGHIGVKVDKQYMFQKVEDLWADDFKILKKFFEVLGEDIGRQVGKQLDGENR